MSSFTPVIAGTRNKIANARASVTERPMASAVSPAARMRPATMSAPAVAPPPSRRARTAPPRRGPSTMGLAHASAMGLSRMAKPQPKANKKPFGSY